MLIPACMIFLCFISTIFISVVYGQVFEFDENDYIGSTRAGEGGNNQDNKDSMSSNNEDAASTNSNSEDTDKENCINNQIESVLASNYDMSSDPYTSEFHFVKKFDKNGNLLDSWGTVGSQDGQFLHAHGITIDSEDNVYVSDAENCNIQKFD
ncbi:MAG TPA: hypothetical protein VFK40_00395, partial [Nitrososphaeraceae archaeon]|nr:hypothetical protein [Nitrososphaeraceae archaeon]